MGRRVFDFWGIDGCCWGGGGGEVGGVCVEELGEYWEDDGVSGGVLGRRVIFGVLAGSSDGSGSGWIFGVLFMHTDARNLGVMAILFCILELGKG